MKKSKDPGVPGGECTVQLGHAFQNGQHPSSLTILQVSRYTLEHVFLSSGYNLHSVLSSCISETLSGGACAGNSPRSLIQKLPRVIRMHMPCASMGISYNVSSVIEVKRPSCRFLHVHVRLVRPWGRTTDLEFR